MRNISKIIVHCSDSDYPHHDNIEIIRKWHVEERKWKDIGYHYVITKNGIIFCGRRLETAGAHCRGHNWDSIGICLTGKKIFSEEQFEALRCLVNNLRLTLGTLPVFPHNFYDKGKTCPNFDLEKDAGLKS